MVRKRFTPADANRTLPLVKRIVADLLERGRELRALPPKATDPTSRQRAREVEAEIRDLLSELERIGCSYKDWGFDVGLVDFPAQIGGQEVLLCWRSDEPQVAWYHEPEAGFAGRTPIPEALLGDRTAAR